MVHIAPYSNTTYVLCKQTLLQGRVGGAGIHHEHGHRARLACVACTHVLATAWTHASQCIALATVLLVVADGIVGGVGVGTACTTAKERALVVDRSIEGRVLGKVGR